jgi:L-ribulose-5-phosphate 4-epimerase
MNEGVIKFRCEWTREPIVVDPVVLASLRSWRSRLRRAGFLGVLPDGTGFGNVSVRGEGQSFLITGSGTGGLVEVDATHLALVTEFRFQENFLACRGLTQASSESLSHAAVCAACPDAGAVIHIHSEPLWREGLNVLPTTDPALEYGTLGLALALRRLIRRAAAGNVHAVVKGGHRDGLIVFGPDLGEAGEGVLSLAASLRD